MKKILVCFLCAAFLTYLALPLYADNFTNLNNSLLQGGTISGNLAITGEFSSSDTADLGWSVQSGANTACTTTCTSAAVVGFDAGTGTIVGPADATADDCLCAGAS